MSDNIIKIQKDGQDIELFVRKPIQADLTEAQKIYHSTIHASLSAGAILRLKLDDFARGQGLWNDEKENKYKVLRQEILEAERQLGKGGIRLSDARRIALNTRMLPLCFFRKTSPTLWQLLFLILYSTTPHAIKTHAT